MPALCPTSPGTHCFKGGICPPNPGHTNPSLNSKSHVWGSNPRASIPRGRGVTSSQPECPSLFCRPEGCKKRELIYKETGVPGEYYSSGESGEPSAQNGAKALPIIPV